MRFAALLLALLALAPRAGAQVAPERRPNVVLILADDLGYGDLGAYGQARIRTPNLDRMAREGLRFTQFYAGGAVCVPSRAVLMTGKHTGHAALRINVTQPLPPEETTLAEHLRAAGYRTACSGKWALGNSVASGSPRAQGFDTYFGFIDQIQAHRHYPEFLLRDDERVALDGNPSARTHYSHDLFTEEALRFLEAARETPGRPFFLYLPYSLPHADLDVPADALAPYRDLGWSETPYVERGGERLYSDQPTPRAAYAAMVARIDRDVGRILDRLRELELERDTLVLFSSDNGPSSEGGGDPEFFDSNGPFRGEKGALYEGGLRVPLLARWPGRIAPGTSAQLAAAWDLFPTLAELAGTPAPADLDGISLVPTLLGRPEQRAHAYLYWEHSAPGPFHSQAVRAGDLKALRLAVHARRPRVELYDLAQDPGETRDIAAERPADVARLVALMDEAHVRDPRSPLTYRELNTAPGRGGRER
ncbi:MAG TPA: arylsulfatase [Planctomycetota bacterium]